MMAQESPESVQAAWMAPSCISLLLLLIWILVCIEWPRNFGVELADGPKAGRCRCAFHGRGLEKRILGDQNPSSDVSNTPRGGSAPEDRQRRSSGCLATSGDERRGLSKTCTCWIATVLWDLAACPKPLTVEEAMLPLKLATRNRARELPVTELD